jgi:hypothetical protein
MVAHFNRETFSDALLTPRPDPSDAEEVLRALETARELEARGEIREAARCLRTAADAAEQHGNDARVLVLARAAADLTNTLSPVSLVTAPVSQSPAQVTLPNKPIPERKVRVGSVRVAFAGSMQESSFVVHRLATGQPLPDGMMEAILVLTGDVEGRVEIETTLQVVDRSGS